ncbi:MAG TPA: class I SAM-dependent methyltransferase [Frankiaceae bacterium]|nr:class I SAM-dependent methyltransferase [Frankiaceae bacterium]
MPADYVAPAHEPASEVGYGDVDQDEAVRASRRWWDAEADNYQAEHGGFLGGSIADGDFVWCPEGLREQDAHLLGPVEDLVGRRVLEVGAGAAQCSRWLAAVGAAPIALDLSMGQLLHARRQAGGPTVPLLLADATVLPLADDSLDLACSAFGAVPFVADSAALHREIARVLRPGSRWVFSVNHPMRWCFRDDPGPEGLVVERSYFDRSAYLELGAGGQPVYVESHRTMGDRIRELVAAGFEVLDVVEPEWPEEHTRVWGQWSPLRGRLFPGTAILVSRLIPD